MDRCPVCKSQAYFYGLQSRPIQARWIVCYECRGASGKNIYSFMTERGEIGSTSEEPNKGYFKGSKEISDEVRDAE